MVAFFWIRRTIRFFLEISPFSGPPQERPCSQPRQPVLNFFIRFFLGGTIFLSVPSQQTVSSVRNIARFSVFLPDPSQHGGPSVRTIRFLLEFFSFSDTPCCFTCLFRLTSFLYIFQGAQKISKILRTSAWCLWLSLNTSCNHVFSAFVFFSPVGKCLCLQIVFKSSSHASWFHMCCSRVVCTCLLGQFSFDASCSTSCNGPKNFRNLRTSAGCLCLLIILHKKT